MDRFKILKNVDPFSDLPRGDTSCKYKFMGVELRGWRMDESNLILDMGMNQLAYFQTLKESAIEIHDRDGLKMEIFSVQSIFKKTPFKDSKGRKMAKVHLMGQLTTTRYERSVAY